VKTDWATDVRRQRTSKEDGVKRYRKREREYLQAPEEGKQNEDESSKGTSGGKKKNRKGNQRDAATMGMIALPAKKRSEKVGGGGGGLFGGAARSGKKANDGFVRRDRNKQRPGTGGRGAARSHVNKKKTGILKRVHVTGPWTHRKRRHRQGPGCRGRKSCKTRSHRLGRDEKEKNLRRTGDQR